MCRAYIRTVCRSESCRPYDAVLSLDLAGLNPIQLAAPRSSISKRTRLSHSVPAISRPLFHAFCSFPTVHSSSARVVVINAVLPVLSMENERERSRAAAQRLMLFAASGGLAGPRAADDWRPAADSQSVKHPGPGPELDDLTVRRRGASRCETLRGRLRHHRTLTTLIQSSRNL